MERKVDNEIVGYLRRVEFLDDATVARAFRLCTRCMKPISEAVSDEEYSKNGLCESCTEDAAIVRNGSAEIHHRKTHQPPSPPARHMAQLGVWDTGKKGFER